MKRDDEMVAAGEYMALQELFDETVSLFHLLRALAAQLHRQGEMTAGRRGILRGLDRLGPQTVPQMARARPVSRQHIQLEVNQLEAEGLVELVANVAHRRSRLVRLTPKGKAHLEEMYQREAELFATLDDVVVPADTVRSASATLRTLRAELAQVYVRLSRSTHEPEG
jgi:DNA-binding MarR family transcriptional regulator